MYTVSVKEKGDIITLSWLPDEYIIYCRLRNYRGRGSNVSHIRMIHLDSKKMICIIANDSDITYVRQPTTTERSLLYAPRRGGNPLNRHHDNKRKISELYYRNLI